MIEELYTVINIIIKNAKIKMKSTMVKKKKILYSSCIMHQKLFKGGKDRC